MWNGDMKLNKLTADQTRMAETPEGMRQLIAMYAWHDSMTRAINHASLARDMSTLDYMTHLAFEALRAKEALTDQLLEWNRAHVNHPIILGPLAYPPLREQEE